jgi:hypothetical protein
MPLPRRAVDRGRPRRVAKCSCQLNHLTSAVTPLTLYHYCRHYFSAREGTATAGGDTRVGRMLPTLLLSP